MLAMILMTSIIGASLFGNLALEGSGRINKRRLF